MQLESPSGHSVKVDAAARDDAVADGIELAQLLLSKDDLSDIAETMSSGHRTWVGRLTTETGRRLVVKRYEYTSLSAILHAFFVSKAEREFGVLEQLHDLVGNPVRPVLWADRRGWGRLTRSVLVTEEFEGTDYRELRNQILRGERPMEEKASIHAILEEVVRTLATLHDKGVYLRDALDKNLLMSVEDGRWSWIDCPRARFRGAPLSARERADDLAAMDKGLVALYSRSERLALFRSYLGRTELTAADRDLLRRTIKQRRRREHDTFFTSLRHHGRRKLLRLPGIRHLRGVRNDKRSNG